MRRLPLIGTILIAFASKPLAHAEVPYCWDRSDDCWFHANWVPENDRTYWTMSCDDGGFYSGSLSGDQTGILC